MNMIVLDRNAQERFIRERQEAGRDRHDEVWDGDYLLMPDPDFEHQGLANMLCTILTIVVGIDDPDRVFGGGNISDREESWTQNYRVPDVAVYLAGNPARRFGTHVLGGPDLAVEIVSPYDRSWDKIPFYAGVGVRELWIVDRDPWSLELYRLQNGELLPVGLSTQDRPEALASTVLPVSFRLIPGNPRPRIAVVHVDGVQRWLA